MTRVSTAFALTALAAATVALAQVAPQTSAAPPPSSAPQEQSANSSASPAETNADRRSESSPADKEALMKRCVAQVQAANPGVPEKDVKQFCAREVYQATQD